VAVAMALSPQVGQQPHFSGSVYWPQQGKRLRLWMTRLCPLEMRQAVPKVLLGVGMDEEQQQQHPLKRAQWSFC